MPKAEHNRMTILNHFTDGSTKSINSEYFATALIPFLSTGHSKLSVMIITYLLQREHGECLITSTCLHWLVGCMEHVNTCTTRHTDTPMLPQLQPHYPFLAQHTQPGTLERQDTSSPTTEVKRMMTSLTGLQYFLLLQCGMWS